MAEIQQSSNITYRVYDYQREDANHCRRELHIDQAAAVAGFLPPLQGHRPMGNPRQKDGYVKTLLVQCPYFAVTRYEIQREFCSETGEDFAVLHVVGGDGSLTAGTEEFSLTEGDCIYLPEKLGAYKVSGNLEILMSEVP